MTLLTKVAEYDKIDIVQGDQTEVTAHQLILRLSTTHWTKICITVCTLDITIINIYVFIQTQQCVIIKLTCNQFGSLDYHQAIIT